MPLDAFEQVALPLVGEILIPTVIRVTHMNDFVLQLQLLCGKVSYDASPLDILVVIMHSSPSVEGCTFMGPAELDDLILQSCPQVLMIVNVQLPPVIYVAPQSLLEFDLDRIASPRHVEIPPLAHHIAVPINQLFNPS
jgi:hypothetical protein